MPFPKLPPRAAYITIRNPTKRNILSLAVLQDLRAQLATHLTSPQTKSPLLLPAFKPHVITTLEADAQIQTRRLASVHESTSAWLVRAPSHTAYRGDLPQVLVLRSEGADEFSAGHDVDEFAAMDDAGRSAVASVMAHIVGLIRHSPAIVVAPVQGFASGIGFQLAMLADVTIAMADTQFQLPGMGRGLPDIGALSVASGVPTRQLYRMYAMGEAVTAAELGAGALDVVPVPEAGSGRTREEVFEERVARVVERLATETAGMAQAFGKWAFWTHRGMRSPQEASLWISKAMTVAASRDHAVEGMSAFREGRTPEWPVWKPEWRSGKKEPEFKNSADDGFFA